MYLRFTVDLTKATIKTLPLIAGASVMVDYYAAQPAFHQHHSSGYDYTQQEEEWDREGLLDPAWEKQQKKVTGDSTWNLDRLGISAMDYRVAHVLL